MKIEGLMFLITFICPLISFVIFYWMYLMYSVSKMIVDIIWDIKAKKKARRVIVAGFLGCLTQMAGFTYGIYFVDSLGWNEMEPWTWMCCKLQLLTFNRIFLHDDRLGLLHEVPFGLQLRNRIRCHAALLSR